MTARFQRDEYERIQTCLPYEQGKEFKENLFKTFPKLRNLATVADLLEWMDAHRSPIQDDAEISCEGYLLDLRASCAAYLSRYISSLTLNSAFELINGSVDWRL